MRGHSRRFAARIIGASLALGFAAQAWAATPLPAGWQFTEYNLSAFTNPRWITAGPDGALWFTEGSKVGRITTGGLITEFAVPSTTGTGAGLQNITTGPDGALWFTEQYTNKIGRITTSGVITEYAVPTANATLEGIVAGPDGALWFTEAGNAVTSPPAPGKIGRITTAGVITEYTVIPNIADSVVGRPAQITVGSDGALWYTLGVGQVGRIDTTGRQISTPLTGGPGGPFLASFTSIINGPDGELWTTDYSNSIYFIPPVFTSGGGGQLASIVEIPLATSFNLPNRMTTGPDGNIWFTESFTDKLGRIPPTVGGKATGSVTEFAIPTSGGGPAGITTGPDGAIWFTEKDGNKIGRLGPPNTLRTGAVFSTAQSSSQSFLRFFNTGAAAGTATVTLRDYASGQSLGVWTSPSIPAGAELQYFIGSVESGAGSFTKPSYYSVSMQSSMTGYFQHVLYRPADGTLTNLSTCAAGVTADPTKLSGVHSSLLAGFPSSVVVNNTGATAAAVTLGIYDARDGTKIGTYTTSSIPANGQAVIAVSTIEAAVGQIPATGMYHYVVKVQGTFTGYLQHLLTNTQAGVVTDMTTACLLGGAAVTTGVSPLLTGAVFSTTQPNSQSFLRFFNTGATAGTATVTLRDYASGQSLGVWTSPSIPAGAELQYFIGSVESGAGNFTKPSYYSVSMQSTMTGYFQHVLYRPADGTLTNLSTCAAGVTADPTKLSGVHSTLLSGFPSSVVVINTATAAAAVTLGIYDARDGTKVGTYTTASLPANGQAVIAVSAIETAMGKAPATGLYHYVIRAEGTFTGFLQHLLTNTQAGVVTDMTTACALTP